MSNEVTTPFSFEVRRRSSKISALTAVALLSVSCLWVATWGGRQVYAVKAFHDQPIPSLSASPTPFAASLAGLVLHHDHRATHSARVRFIDVTGNFAELFEGGQLRAVVALQVPLIKGHYVINLSTLTKALHRPSWLSETSPGVFSVRAGLLIEQGAVVDLHAPEVMAINLIDQPGVYFALSGAGVSVIRGITIQVPHAPVWTSAAIYRPFVDFANGADVRVSDARIIDLGWDWSNSSGLTWSNGATGSLTSSLITGNYMGVSAEAAPNFTISHSTIRRSTGIGVRITKRSDNASIDRNVITQNQSDGVLIDSFSFHDTVSHNEISSNGASGVLAWKGAGSLVITSNHLAHNRGDGIFFAALLFGASIENNTITNNRIGISGNGQEQGPTTGNVIAHNRMSVQGITIDSSTNRVDQAATGYATIAPSKWWRRLDVLLALATVGLVLYAVRVRRETLRYGWEVSMAGGDDVRSHRYTAAYRRALAEAARHSDESSPIGPIERLDFIPQVQSSSAAARPPQVDSQRPTAERWFRTSVFVVIALLGTIQIVGGIGLFADGGYIFNRLLQTQSHLIISSGRTFSQYATQEPLLLALHFHVHQMAALQLIWTASLVLEPLLLWVTALVLVRKHHMFWYFVLAFFAIYGLSSGFVIGEYNLAYGLVAASAAQLFAGLTTARARWRLVGLSACTIFSYPMMVVLGPTLLALLWWTYRQAHIKTSPLRYTCGFAAVAFAGAAVMGAIGILTNQSGDLGNASANSLKITSVTVLLGLVTLLLALGRSRDSRFSWAVVTIGLGAFVVIGRENIGTSFAIREQVAVVLVALITFEILGSRRFPTSMPRAFRVATLGIGVVMLISVGSYSLGFRHYQQQLVTAVRTAPRLITHVDGVTSVPSDDGLYHSPYYWGDPNAFLAMDLVPSLASPRFLSEGWPSVRPSTQGLSFHDIPLPFFVHFGG